MTSRSIVSDNRKTITVSTTALHIQISIVFKHQLPRYYGMNVRENERDTNLRTIHGKKTIKTILKVKQDGLHQKLEGEPSSRTLMATTRKINARENLTIQRHTQHCA